MESVNSAHFKRWETEVQNFWQGKAQNSSPILRCTFLARRSAKLIANFNATMVTSLPSFSLSLYLSLSLSHTHRMYLTHNIGSAEALPILCVRYFRWEREIQTERERGRERRKWRHHCRAKIGDEFTLSHAKNSLNWRWAYTFPCQSFALFVSPFTLPVSPCTERSPLWRWNSQRVHTFHCQKNFRPLCSPSFKWHEPRDEWSKTQDKWSNPAKSNFVLPIEKLNQINTKNYWK